ncbi:MAG TPA: gluconate 2-dehydrogenase subunit 3 family protein, partial [Acidimicrobiales bacterium]|nr:gluconate 2-dehydrogenase subunit 3 family protein [Acidimicrobiales bacterium]
MADVDGHRPRFPGFEVTDQAATWDEVTRRVVLGRLDPPGPLRFFTSDEARTARALTDRLLGQTADQRLPVVEVIDRRLADRTGDGYRYADLPEDAEAWRRSLAALDEDAAGVDGRPFADLHRDDQMDLV